MSAGNERPLPRGEGISTYPYTLSKIRQVRGTTAALEARAN